MNNVKNYIYTIGTAFAMSGCVSVPVHEQKIKVQMLVSNNLYLVSPEYLNALDSDQLLCKLVSEGKRTRSAVEDFVSIEGAEIKLQEAYNTRVDTITSQYFLFTGDNINKDLLPVAIINPDKLKAILYSQNCNGTSSEIKPDPLELLGNKNTIEI